MMKDGRPMYPGTRKDMQECESASMNSAPPSR